MAVKVLVTSLGQHLIADTKQITRTDDDELIAYWVENPRVITYNRTESGEISISFIPYCMVSDETAFSIKESYITSILEVREDVLNSYKQRVFGNESGANGTQDGANPDDSDGADGVRTESASGETDAGVGEDEAVTAELA